MPNVKSSSVLNSSASQLPKTYRSPQRLHVPRPRLLLVANSSWYLWNFRLELARQLVRTGFDIVFAAPPDTYSQRLEACAPFEPVQLDRRGVNPGIEAWTVIRFIRLLRRVRPDVLLTWTPKSNIYGGLAAHWHDLPVIPNVSGLGHAFVRRGGLQRLSGALYKYAFRRAQTVLFQNSVDLQQFVDSGWVRTDAARLLPGSGVDLDRFQPRTQRRSDSSFLFLFVGRMLANKGLRELAGAMRRLKQDGLQARLRLVGFIDRGNPAAIDEREIRDWETEGLLEYHGPTDTVEQDYLQADCIVLPSSYREGIPRAILEAAACGLPVITTDAPGCRDAVTDGITGFLCRPGDTASLITAMQKMIRLPADARAAMGNAARDLMERLFSQQLVFDAYRDAIDSVLQRSRRRRRPQS